ncbi:MAG: hypothetical protein PQJ59_09660 [Spirochaetales bacterium]|nr:hypothetical protein [Spirochaetales bacterium]
MVKKNILILILSLVAYDLFSQTVTEMEFRNQPITDILLVLAEVGNQSILPDETVDGKASYSFHNMPFETALTLFLDNQGLYFEKKDDVYYISRIYSKYNGETDKISLKTEEEDLQTIIKHISRRINKTILYDSLPRDELAIQFDEGDVESLLNIIIKKHDDYSLETGEDYFYIHKQSSSGSRNSRTPDVYFTTKGELLSARLENVGFRNVLLNLMEIGGHEYSLMGKNDYVIEVFNFKEKTYEQMLDLLMEQGSCGYQVVDGIYYIFDRDRDEILNKLQYTVDIPLDSLSADSLTSLLPSSLVNNLTLRQDPRTNSLIATGNLDSLETLESFIDNLDRENPDYGWTRFNLVHLDADEISSLLPDRFSGETSVVLSEANAVLYYLTEGKAAALEDYINLIDVPNRVFPVYLDYVSAEDLLDNLPPNMDDSEIYSSYDDNLVYFVGEEAKLLQFKDTLAVIDKPVPQIRYDILVIQVQDTNQLDWDSSFTSEILDEDTQTAVTGTLGSVLSLNFDIVSQLGYQFAANLSAALNKSEAKIMVDSTIYGLSGEAVEFQNSGTSRYYEASYDEDGELEDEGTITEISSGIFIDLEGSVSGDGMITMDVETTISKENSVDSTSTYALPSTTEKVVTTRVRSMSGEPIILSGLKQQDISYSISKVPILGSIPLLGLLFQTRQEIVEYTDFYVTIVPFIEYTNAVPLNDRFENIYNHLVAENDS